MLIDFVPTISGLSLAEAPAFKKAPGGAPANVAVGIARLGGSSAFIGKVGEDEFGYMLADILKENNVNNEGMRFDPGARTALAFVTLRSDGEREFMFYRNPSADMLLQENELDFDLITKATIFHYGSISLITEPCKSAHIAAAKVAKDAGVVLSYDPNLRLPLWPSAGECKERDFEHLGYCRYYQGRVSEEEISFLTQGEDPYDDAVVPGPFGTVMARIATLDEFSGKVKGLKVEAVDTTGAGDAFVAGTLSQLASDLSLIQDEDRLRNALKFSNVCGALTVTERGDPFMMEKFPLVFKSKKEKANNDRIFKRFDVNGDGKISAAELGEALKALGCVSVEEVSKMMSEMDTDGDGFISYEEFIAFAAANRGLMKDVAKIL
ncbi:hypothetical protein GOBAR_DD08629 [Gossypium barbadense]|nr:hypothetical protein GOBAR_DD08629 [Gossypium barbadense]